MGTNFSFLEMMRIGSAKVLLFGAALLFALLASLLLDAKPAHADDITVNSMEDNAGDDNRGNGVCDTGLHPPGFSPICTLRAAIEEANATDKEDTINFSSGLSGTITLTLGPLLIENDNLFGPD